ncbi:MAG: DUF6807 family protein [Fuerstiella sp.]
MKLKQWFVYFALLMRTSAASYAETLTLREDCEAGTIKVFRKGEDTAILTQNAGADFRPYLHPILAPDGKGVLTELSPDHHVHQTGVYWGFTRANGRDYFGNPGGGYWRRVSCRPLIKEGDVVQWETIYQMLDEAGGLVMIETQRWTLRDTGDRYFLNLRWTGEAATDVTIGNYFYGGLFVRMPWHKGIDGASVNSIGRRNRDGDSQRALWVDVAMAIEGRDDWGHIAILEHPQNHDFPQPWRVDKNMGVGPSRAKLGGWKINKGEKDVYQHQLVIYTGDLNESQLNEDWLQYSGEKTLPPSSGWPGGVITIKKP